MLEVGGSGRQGLGRANGVSGDVYVHGTGRPRAGGAPRFYGHGYEGRAHLSLSDLGLRQVSVRQRVVFPVDAAAAIPRAGTAIGLASVPYGPGVAAFSMLAAL